MKTTPDEFFRGKRCRWSALAGLAALALMAGNLSATIHYVSLDSGTPVAPYTTWASVC